MKKLTTIAALALLFSTSAFATEGKKTNSATETKVTKNVQAAFLQDFKEAANVNWNKTQEFYFADFNLKDENMSAAYDEGGNLLGMSREIDISKMPIAAQRSLQQEFSDYTFGTEITELTYEGLTHYYLKAENKDKILKLKCSPDGAVTVEKTFKKKRLVGRVY